MSKGAAAPTAPLEPEEIRRYGRHLVLPEVGREGQERLKAARVLLVGLGGLGSPLGLYLAAAGVGTLGLVDDDEVDESNLQRQVLYGTRDLGRRKLDAACERLADVNPHVRLEPHARRFDLESAARLVAAYDLVVDGSDNFPTRYLINDACVLGGKPDVWGAVQRFEGQVAVFAAAGGPCYRCLFPEPPPAGLVPSCAEGGVIGVLPGVVGAVQASEVLKLLLGVGEPLIGRLTIFDALTLRWREVQLPRDPGCPVCGDAPTRTTLSEIELSCPSDPEPPREPVSGAASEVPFEIEVEDLEAWLEEGRALTLIDVREPVEHQICRIDGARLLPLRELPERIDELDRDAVVVVHCHHGPRSAQAVGWLRQQGVRRATNLAGGIDAWSLRVDPSVPRY